MEADRTDAALDPTLAVHYGAFITAAYQMHGIDPDNPTPAPLPLPSSFKFVAWIQMKDFIVASGDWAFYGLLAQSTEDLDKFVLAIRGTSNPEEWWDDLTSVVPAPWIGPGLVGFGFNRIYQTLRIIDLPPTPTLGGMALPVPVQAGSFAEQVVATVRRHAAAARPAAIATAAPPIRTIAVTGHSLGAALATLYVAEHAHKAGAGTLLDGLQVSTLCTFASPRTGDPTFARAFDALPVTSWRVVNELDVVPKLPVIGFEHVDQLQQYNSGWMVRWSPTCWHSLTTYLHLLDPKLPLAPECAPSIVPKTAAAAMEPATLLGAKLQEPASKDLSLAVPPGNGTTITITIKTG
jgi:triacylglycerol lipase